MAQSNALSFTTPPARWVQGSIWDGQTTDMNGQPLVWKSGPDQGKPRQSYFFAIAIPKAGEQHWSQTPWGAVIWQAGHAGMSNANQRPNFAWKVVDGDSQVLDERGKRPCDKEGFPGHWVLRMSGNFAPEVGILQNGSWRVLDKSSNIKCGDYLQVQAEVEFNGDNNKPGVYLNHRGVKYHGPGELIRTGGFDAMGAGFVESQPGAGAAVPAGAGGFVPPPAPGAMQPGAPAPAYQPPPAPPAAAPAAYQPHPGILGAPAYQPPPAPGAMQPGAPAPAYQPPPAPPAAVIGAAPPIARQMTAKANGASYEAMTAAGWSDDLLRQHGYMV